MVSAVPPPESEARSVRPFFMPSGVGFQELPEELKAAIVAVVNPAYRQLVLEARDGLEKSTGVTVVHLLWLEILDQIELAQSFKAASHPEVSDERGKLIERHLRLIGAKSKASHFLLRLNEFKRKWGLHFLDRARRPQTMEPSDDFPAEDQPGG